MLGVEDFDYKDNKYIVRTSCESLQKITESFESDGYNIKSADYEMYPGAFKQLKKEEATKLFNFLEVLYNNDDICKIYSNYEVV